MGINIDHVSLEDLPPMELVRDKVGERLGLRVELIQHPAGFRIEVQERYFCRLVPSERALVLDTYQHPQYPLAQQPHYLLLCRALAALGGQQQPIERLEWCRSITQRFEFQKGAPGPLEVHEQLRRLGGTASRPLPTSPGASSLSPLLFSRWSR